MVIGPFIFCPGHLALAGKTSVLYGGCTVGWLTNLWYFSKPHWISWGQTQIHTIGLSTLGMNDFEDSYCQGHFYLVLFPSTTEGHPVCDLDGRFTWGGVSVYISTSSCSRRSFFCLKPSICFLSKMGPYVGLLLGWSIEPHRFLFHLGWPETCRLQARAQIGAMEKENLGW